MNKSFLSEHRCFCGKLLLKGVFFDGIAEVKCRGCGKINSIGSIKIENDNSHYTLILNDKGIVSNCSDSVKNILGYSNIELIGKNFILINPRLSKGCFERIFGEKTVLNENNYLKIDTLHQTKDGRFISVSVLLKNYKPNPKEKYILLLAELNNKIEKKENKFRDKSCDFYFEIDKNGIGTYMNCSMDSFFEIPTDAYVGKEHFDILPVKQRVESIKEFLHFSLLEEPYRTKNDDVKIGNKIVNYEAFFSPIFSDSRKFVGYRVLCWINKAVDK